LIDAVIGRRLEPVNRKRIQMLDAAGPTPTIEQVVTAFMAPIIEKEVWPAGPLIGRVFSNPDQFLGRVFQKHLAPVAQRFAGAIAQALPDLPPEDVLWRLHFMAGAMAHVMVFSEVLPLMTGGVCHTRDRRAVTAQLVTFLSAGLRAPAPVLEKNALLEKN
jgi:hypothetical protein